MALAAIDVPFFAANGFVRIPAFADRGEVASINDRISLFADSLLHSLPSTGFATIPEANGSQRLCQLNNLQAYDPYFAAIQRSKAWRDIAAALLGEDDLVPSGIYWFNKPPRTDFATPPHQDQSSLRFDPPAAVMMWLALDATDEENGCLTYLPGSHNQGLRTHEKRDAAAFTLHIPRLESERLAEGTAVRCSAGDLVVHHALTIHFAAPNRSVDRERRALMQIFRSGRSLRLV